MKKILILLIFMVSLEGLAQANQTNSGIYVTGEGVVKVIPDQVLIKARIEHEGDSAEEVKRQNDRVVDAILKYLKNEGISEKDITTDYLNLNKRYNYNEKTYSYAANQAISIHLRDLEDYERIMKGLLENGLNRIDGVQFQSSEIEKYKADARRKAVLNAEQKAQELAEPLGQKIGSAFRIDDTTRDNFQPVYRMAEMKMSDSGESQESIAPGEMEVRVEVNVAFELHRQQRPDR